MKIVRHKTTYTVYYLFSNNDECRLDQYGMWGKVRALDMKDSTHEIVEDVSKQDVFVGGAYGYDTDWFVIDQDRVDERYDIQVQEEIDAKCARVQQIRMDKTYSDEIMQFPDGSYNTIQFRNDFDRQNVSNLALGALAETVGGKPNKKMKFRDKDNKVHDIKTKDLVGLSLGVMDKKQKVVETAWAHKDTLKAMKTLEEVRKYNINEGWPS